MALRLCGVDERRKPIPITFQYINSAVANVTLSLSLVAQSLTAEQDDRILVTSEASDETAFPKASLWVRVLAVGVGRVDW